MILIICTLAIHGNPVRVTKVVRVTGVARVARVAEVARNA